MAWVLPLKDTPPIPSIMLLVMSALSPAVLIRIPVLWRGLVSEKPSMVTSRAWIVISGNGETVPVMVDSANGFVRPATGFVAWAPLRVRDLGIITFSAYAPGATLIGSQVTSLTADWIVG